VKAAFAAMRLGATLKRARRPADTTDDMVLRRPWIAAALGLALGAFGVYLLLVVLGNATGDAYPDSESWLYHALIVAAVLITVARAVLVRDDRLAWSAIAAGLACWAFGELYSLAAAPAGFPSLADLGWIAFYPLAYVGIVLLVQRRARSSAGTLWLDGLTAAVTAAALGSAVLVEVVLRTLEGSSAAIATNLAYPLGDVLLLSAIFGVFSLAGWKFDRRWLLLGLGILATTVADGVYLFEVETYQEGGLVDVLWPASSLLIAFAAWIDPSDERGLEIEGRPLLAVPAACALVVTGILVVDHFAGVNLLAVGLAAGGLLLVLLRLAITFRENGRLFRLTRHEAVTDALTGLGNRRRLVADLEGVFDAPEGRPTLLMILDLDGFKGYNDSFGHPAGDALLSRLAEKLAAVAGERGGAYRLGGDEFCLLVPVTDGDAERIIDGACAALVERGEGFDVSSSFGAVLLPAESGDASHALSLADERLYAQKRSRREAPDRTLHAFVDALAHHEPRAEPYGDGVAALAVEMGRRLALSPDELDELASTAQLHDLGKLAVPDEILSKPGPLDDREWEFIHRHTVVGERILRASPIFRKVATLVRSSHENWDGTGYPDGLAGEQIPLVARIVHACDAFGAMISERPYRRALTVDAALEELERCAGTQFDPTVARILVAHVREQLEAGRAA
jgi:diguanylate cyclase (GGDEF)-like protein